MTRAELDAAIAARGADLLRVRRRGYTDLSTAGRVVGTAEAGRYALVRWDGGLTLAEPWGGLELADATPRAR